MTDSAPQLGRAVTVRDVLPHASKSCGTCAGTGWFWRRKMTAKGAEPYREQVACRCALRRFEKACAGRFVPGSPDRWIVGAEPEARAT